MDGDWMTEALVEAERAMNEGEVPVGAVVVKDGKIIGRGHNEVEKRKEATAHAEMLAIREASKNLGDWRLDGCTVYVTSEPCHMCVGAFYLSRVSRVVFGVKQPRSGACGSVDNFHELGLFNQKIKVTGGVEEEKCRLLLQEFFNNLRRENI